MICRAESHQTAPSIASQAEFVDVRVVGEFEDAEWIVDPQANALSS